MSNSDARKKPDIRLLFEPKTVAVIGASAQPGKIGYSICRNIKEGGYQGKLYPVNPKGGTIFGEKVFTSVADIPGEIDVASVTVPANLAFEAVKACADKGVKHIQVITSGFAEIGEADLENEMVQYAIDRGCRVLGPNIFGLFSASARFNSTFSAGTIPSGAVGILTQSGALGIAMIGKCALENIGLSAIVSMGNKADIDEADCLEYLIQQDLTKAILLYIEGIKGGDRFLQTLRAATKVKPVVVLKSGRSKRGAMAAASHTGSLAGTDEICDAILRQCGALRAETLQDAFNWCKCLKDAPLPKGERCVIVTNGGGVGVMATDACEKYGVELYDDQKVLAQAFDEATPDFGSTKNPVDITGAAGAKDYDLALAAPAKCPTMDSAIALYCETAVFNADNLVEMVRGTYKTYQAAGKPITYALVGGKTVAQAAEVLKEEQIPVYTEVYDAVSNMGALYTRYRMAQLRDDKIDEARIDLGAIEKTIDAVLADGRSFLLANEGQAVMRAAGVTIPGAKIAKSADECAKAAEAIGFPVVMKVVSRDILHKSDAGGVVLNLKSAGEVREAYERIMNNCRAYKKDAVIDGIEVVEMVKPGVDLIVGARKDGQMGPIIMVGMGGIYVEVMKDVAFRSANLSRGEAQRMLQSIRCYPMLAGARGQKPKDTASVVDHIIKLATIIKRVPRITDIEINPVVVYEQGCKAVDVRILIKK